jgi:hypothetical protein
MFMIGDNTDNTGSQGLFGKTNEKMAGEKTKGEQGSGFYEGIKAPGSKEDPADAKMSAERAEAEGHQDDQPGNIDQAL